MNHSMIAIIAARMGSSRLPGKVMMPLAGKPVFQHLIERIQASGVFKTIVLGTSLGSQNHPLIDCAEQCGIEWFQGSEDDLADRYLRILDKFQAGNFTRFCADNPLTDMETSARLVHLHLENQLDYASVKGLHLPLGLVETYSQGAIDAVWRETDPGDVMRRESIGIYVRENPRRFRIQTLPPDPLLHQSSYRLTLDYPEDYELLKIIFDRLYLGKPIPFVRVLEFLREHPEIAALNATMNQKAGNLYWEELDARLP